MPWKNDAYYKQYNQKRKKLAWDAPNEEYEKIILHIHNKGYAKASDYIKALIYADMQLKAGGEPDTPAED